MTESVLDKLNQLIDFLEKHEWTTDVCARDKDGREVLTDDPSAVSFCILGAIGRIVHDETGFGAIDWKLHRFLTNEAGGNLSCWNDQRASKEEVIAFLRQCAQKLAAQPS
jgi:hypothetical protein